MLVVMRDAWCGYLMHEKVKGEKQRTPTMLLLLYCGYYECSCKLFTREHHVCISFDFWGFLPQLHVAIVKSACLDDECRFSDRCGDLTREPTLCMECVRRAGAALRRKNIQVREICGVVCAVNYSMYVYTTFKIVCSKVHKIAK